MLTRRTLLVGTALVPAARWRPARADTWPSKPVRIVVPYPPGGSSDISARLVADKLSQAFSQRFVVENKPGAGGNVGMEVAAQSAPDGYTLALATTAHAINMTLFKSLPYDTLKSFAPVALVTENPLVLVVRRDLPPRSVQEFVALAKQKPGELNYASSGNGQSTHLAAELFAAMAGIRITHVPYRGSAPAIKDVVAGQVDLMFDTTQSVLPHVTDGAVRALGVTSAARSPALADTPTIAESGLPGYEAIAWNGLVAPKGTPDDIVARLNAEVVRALALPDVQERFGKLGATVRPTTPPEFGRHIEAEIAKWGKVVKDTGAKVD